MVRLNKEPCERSLFTSSCVFCYSWTDHVPSAHFDSPFEMCASCSVPHACGIPAEASCKMVFLRCIVFALPPSCQNAGLFKVIRFSIFSEHVLTSFIVAISFAYGQGLSKIRQQLSMCRVCPAKSLRSILVLLIKMNRYLKQRELQRVSIVYGLAKQKFFF